MSNLPGHTWLSARVFPDGERNLLAAVILLALRDVLHGRLAQRHDAIIYLRSENFRIDCACLGLNPRSVLEFLEVYP